MVRFWTILSLLTGLTSGCATLTLGLHQSITVVAEERDELTCVFQRDSEEWPVPDIPGTVMVRKSGQPLTLKCDKKGFEPYLMDLRPVYDGFVGEDVALGLGVSLMWVAVDQALASHWSYPDVVEVELKPTVPSKARKTFLRRKRRQGQEESAPPPEEERKANPIYNEFRRALWYEPEDPPELIIKTFGKSLPNINRIPR